MDYKTLILDRSYTDNDGKFVDFKMKFRIPNPKYAAKCKAAGEKMSFPDSCLGEYWFFKTNLWKLHILFGYNWMGTTQIARGFSFIACGKMERFEEVANTMIKYGIKFRQDWSASFTARLYVSQSRKNLATIDELYEKFYKFVKDGADFKETMKKWNESFLAPVENSAA